MICFAVGVWINRTSLPVGGVEFGSELPAIFVGGYLPESGSQKVYLKTQGGKIAEILRQKPDASQVVIETEAWIFPGLMNLHGHLKYNILPLWPKAAGQFLNRFEWRDYPPYKEF